MSYDHYYNDPSARLALTAGSAVVSADAALFAVWVKPGDILFAAGDSAVVASIEDNTHLTLAGAWTGATVTDVTGWLFTRGPGWGRSVDIHSDVVETLQRIRSGTPFRPDAFGSLPDRANYDGADIGFIFLSIDQVPFEFYIKQADSVADWAGPDYVRGDQGIQGFPGWSPQLAAIEDGERRVHQVIGWVGGAGEEPPAGQYIGAGGFVADIVYAIDVRGPIGTVTPELSGLVDRAEVAATSAESDRNAAAGSAAAAASSAEEAEALASSINPATYVKRENNLSDISNKNSALSNLGGGETGISLFQSTTAQVAKSALGRMANTDLCEMPANTLKGRMGTGGDPQDLTPDQVRQLLGFSLLDLVPTGTPIPWVTTTPPTGYLKCNGAAISRTAYAALFAVLGTAFGAGDGTTTFNLPDLRGEFIRGWDDARGVDIGRVLGSAQGHQIGRHAHKTSMGYGGTWHHAWLDGNSKPVFGSEVVSDVYAVVTDGRTVGPTPINLAYTDAEILNASGETRPRNIALMYIIKY